MTGERQDGTARRFVLLDDGFRVNKARYILQCLLATLCVLIILIVLGAVEDTATIASLGASSFIAFAMPHQRASAPRLMLGGYLIGIVVGWVSYMASAGLSQGYPQLTVGARHVVFGALAVGLSVFLMVITQSEHPPAAGLALGLVINGCDVPTLIVVAMGVVLLVVTKVLLKPILVD